MGNRVNNVDVLIPVHGTPIYLSETIQSIIGQEFVNKIIIVLDRVNNEFLSNLDLKYEKLTFIESNNPGIVSALNVGLEISEAQFVARIDSDDIMKPGRIRKQLDYLNSNIQCVCVGSNIEIFGGRFETKIKKYPTSHGKIIRKLLYQNAIAHPSVMFRRESVLEAGGYRTIFEGSEDYDLWFRLSKIGQLNNLNESLTRYRTNSGQYSTKFSTYRVELDSLVRLSNLGNFREFSGWKYNEKLSGTEVKELYRYSLKIVEISDSKLLKLLSNAEQLSKVLSYKSINNKSMLEFVIMISFAFRLILISPLFMIKVLIGRIFR